MQIDVVIDSEMKLFLYMLINIFTEEPQEKAFERLYENSKLKQMREVARKQAAEIQKLQNHGKQKFITPDKAASLYERTLAKKQDREKKIEKLSESMRPTFSPQLVSNDVDKTRPKSRPKSRKKSRQSIDRLYSPNYLRERDEKLKQMKEKIEEEQCTFTPNTFVKNKRLSGNFTKPQSANDNPAWNRLYERRKVQTESNELDDPEYRFKPDISKSQKLLSASGMNPPGDKVYERLYRKHELKHEKVTKHVSTTDDHELTFKPAINDNKEYNKVNEITREQRIENLYRRGAATLAQRRSLSLVCFFDVYFSHVTNSLETLCISY